MFRSEKIFYVWILCVDHYFETPIDESGMRPGKNCVDPIFQSVFYGKREVNFIVDYYKETEW